jgi:hypothetical protein
MVCSRYRSKESLSPLTRSSADKAWHPSIVAKPWPWLVPPSPPIKEESLESWLLRQAHENKFQPSFFHRSYVERLDRCWSTDYDFLDEYPDLFHQVSSWVPGDIQASDLVASSYRSILGNSLYSMNALFTGEKTVRKFCPLCFRNSEQAFLKLHWRVSLVRVCVDHAVMLDSRCCNCNAKFRPRNVNKLFNMRKCNRCGFDLSKNPPELIDRSSDGYNATLELVSILEEDDRRNRNNVFQFSSTGPEDAFLQSLIFVTKFVSLIDLGAINGHSLIGRNAWNRKESNKTLELMGTAWRLLGSEQDLRNLVNHYQSLFNRFVHYWRWCPDFLRKFVGPVHHDIIFSMSKQLARFLADIPVSVWTTPRATCQLLDFSIYNHHEFFEAIDAANRLTDTYYSSFYCQNRSCLESAPDRKMTMELAHLKKKNETGVPAVAMMRCKVCGEYSSFDISAAPLRRDFAESMCTSGSSTARLH